MQLNGCSPMEGPLVFCIGKDTLLPISLNGIVAGNYQDTRLVWLEYKRVKGRNGRSTILKANPKLSLEEAGRTFIKDARIHCLV